MTLDDRLKNNDNKNLRCIIQNSDNLRPHSSDSVVEVTPLQSTQSWKCDPILQHIPTSLFLRCTPRGFGTSRPPHKWYLVLTYTSHIRKRAEDNSLKFLAVLNSPVGPWTPCFPSSPSVPGDRIFKFCTKLGALRFSWLSFKKTTFRLNIVNFFVPRKSTSPYGK